MDSSQHIINVDDVYYQNHIFHRSNNAYQYRCISIFEHHSRHKIRPASCSPPYCMAYTYLLDITLFRTKNNK